MQRRGKIFVLLFIVLGFSLIVFLIYSFLSDESAPPVADTGRDTLFPVPEINELPIPSVESPEDIVGIVGNISEARDDRVYTVGSSNLSSQEEETVETLPRLVRLFAGRTAGYRIDQNENGMWNVRVVEQGRGNRYTISTVPYSLNLTSTGEFTKVHEGYIFSDGNTLVLYENPENELIIKSAFVPFTRTDTNRRIQLFEDNIRVATNNETKFFFTKQVNDKTLGLIVDVSNPNDTEVVWESSFINWLPRWGRAKYITLATPISRFSKGYVYLIDPERIVPTNRPVNILSGGSIFMDTDSGYFILYNVDRGIPNGRAYITDQRRTTDTSIPITLPEKCDGFNGAFVCAVPRTIPSRTLSGYRTTFPDSWYQGDIQLSDSVMLFDAVTREERTIMSPDQRDIQELSGNRRFDIINPTISDDGRFLFFVNKRDFSLWMLKIDE